MELNEQLIHFSNEVTNLIEAGWKERIKQFESQGKSYFNSNLLQFSEIFVNEDNQATIRILQGLTYKDVVGLRYWKYNNSIEIQANQRPVALSTHCITLTSDNYIVLRNCNSGDWDYRYDIQGGFLRQGETDILASQLSFICNDLILESNLISEINSCLIYSYPEICEVQCLYVAKLSVDSEQLLDKSFGKTKIRLCANSKTDVDNFSKIHNLHLPSMLALELYFTQNF